MQLNKVLQKIRKLTNTSSVTLPNTEAIDLVNEAYLYLQRELAHNEIEVFGKIAKTDLVADQSNYTLPSDLLSIIRIEISYFDPSNENNWRLLREADISNLPAEWYRLIRSAPLSRPLFDIFSNNIWVFPAPKENRVQALRLWYIAKQSDFTSEGDLLHPVIQKYWDVLAIGAAWLFFEEEGNVKAQRFFELFQSYLNKMISDLKIDTMEAIKISPIY